MLHIDLPTCLWYTRRMTIKRDLYLGKLISAKHDGFVKIITGIRRMQSCH